MEMRRLRSFREEKLKVPGSPKSTLDRSIMTTDSFIQTQLSPFPAAAIHAFANSIAGSKEDIFFDSHLWLESDCEDDFFSINGDFTPSRGNTPLHHSFKAVTSKPYISKNLVGEITEPLPKKKLADLLEETRAEEDAERRKLAGNTSRKNSEIKPAIVNFQWSSIIGPLQYPDGLERQKSGRCIPGLQLCRSLSGRKKKVMIPAMASGHAV